MFALKRKAQYQSWDKCPLYVTYLSFMDEGTKNQSMTILFSLGGQALVLTLVFFPFTVLTSRKRILKHTKRWCTERACSLLFYNFSSFFMPLPHTWAAQAAVLTEQWPLKGLTYGGQVGSSLVMAVRFFILGILQVNCTMREINGNGKPSKIF